MIDEKYCYLEPDFPRTLYLIISISHDTVIENITDYFYPSYSLAVTLDDPYYQIKSLEKAMQDAGDFVLSDLCLLVPLTYRSKFKLRREFWESDLPEQKISQAQKFNSVMEAVEKYQLYKLLVTASTWNDQWIFIAGFSFYFDTPEKTIERFMLTSNLNVDERIKYCSFYTLGKSIVFNWKTKEKINTEKNPEKAMLMKLKGRLRD